jgi:hypothetical protein
MMGRLGWHGQCSCCGGPSGKDSIRAYERAQWVRDYRDDLDFGWNEIMTEAICRCECHKIYAAGPLADQYCLACTTDYADRCTREQPERRTREGDISAIRTEAVRLAW